MAITKIKGLKALLSNKAVGFKTAVKAVSGEAKTIGLIAGSGALVGALSAPSGLRKEGFREGAFLAGGIGAAATIGMKVVFRRIRGRIIPIRVKAK